MSTTSSSSSSSFLSGTSLSSAPSSWSRLLPHPLPITPATTPRTTMDATPKASSSRKPSHAPPRIAALPSLAHSLSAFPNMTMVTNDMVHYGNLCRTKGASEAKLNSALRITQQRQAAPGALATPTSTAAFARYQTSEDDDAVLFVVPKRSKAKRSS